SNGSDKYSKSYFSTSNHFEKVRLFVSPASTPMPQYTRTSVDFLNFLMLTTTLHGYRKYMTSELFKIPTCSVKYVGATKAWYFDSKLFCIENAGVGVYCKKL